MWAGREILGGQKQCEIICRAENEHFEVKIRSSVVDRWKTLGANLDRSYVVENKYSEEKMRE